MEITPFLATELENPPCYLVNCKYVLECETICSALLYHLLQFYLYRAKKGRPDAFR
jgi:hypothetical protein